MKIFLCAALLLLGIPAMGSIQSREVRINILLKAVNDHFYYTGVENFMYTKNTEKARYCIVVGEEKQVLFSSKRLRDLEIYLKGMVQLVDGVSKS
jgi:hypothetical protein